MYDLNSKIGVKFLEMESITIKCDIDWQKVAAMVTTVVGLLTPHR